MTPALSMPPVEAAPSSLMTPMVRHFETIPSLSPEATPLPVQQVCQFDDSQPTTRHTVVADVQYDRHSVNVQQTIRYINRTGGELKQIVLNVEPMRWQNAFKLESLVIDDSASVDNVLFALNRLTLNLPQPLAVGCAVSLRLRFRLDMPMIGEGLDAFHGYFGYSPRQWNLGHWLPTVATRSGGEWITRQPTLIGEQEVLDEADWDVTFSVIGAADSLVVAAPGTVMRLSPQSWRFNLNHAREFPLSMSESYRVASQQTANGVTVEMYHFEDAAHSAPHALDVAAKALAMYADLYGEYPYQRMLVVQGDFRDGMEFSGLVFVGGEYFAAFDGNPAAYLTVITAHEVSHQWWYAQIGNDQALYPWLDEALATYSEYVFIEEYYPDLKNWWWEFRVDRHAPQGFVDSTVYEFISIREYINAVYLRGVRMLDDLRRDIGTDAFFDLLRRYAKAGYGRVATPELFWSLLTPEQVTQTSDTRARYFRQATLSTNGEGT